MESILTTQPGICYLCQRHTHTECHHIYFGHGRRKISDKHGFIVYLCHAHHRGTYGVHGEFGEENNMDLKRICQAKYEETHTREEFRQLIGKSYL